VTGSPRTCIRHCDGIIIRPTGLEQREAAGISWPGFPNDDEEDAMTDDMTNLNRFEQLMLKDNWPGDSDRARTGVRDVADTMYACREWFEGYKVAFTGADLVAMAKLILAREREIADGIKRAKWERRHEMGDSA
jgi:hypothetical protein